MNRQERIGSMPRRKDGHKQEVTEKEEENMVIDVCSLVDFFFSH